MLNHLEVFDVATALSKHAAHQQSVVANNIANIDSPGFKAQRLAPFHYEKLATESPFVLNMTRESHFMSASHRYDTKVEMEEISERKPNGNTVSLEIETLKSIEAERLHSRAVSVYQSSLNILRSSIGRG